MLIQAVESSNVRLQLWDSWDRDQSSYWAGRGNRRENTPAADTIDTEDAALRNIFSDGSARKGSRHCTTESSGVEVVFEYHPALGCQDQWERCTEKQTGICEFHLQNTKISGATKKPDKGSRLDHIYRELRQKVDQEELRPIFYNWKNNPENNEKFIRQTFAAKHVLTRD